MSKSKEIKKLIAFQKSTRYYLNLQCDNVKFTNDAIESYSKSYSYPKSTKILNSQYSDSKWFGKFCKDIYEFISDLDSNILFDNIQMWKDLNKYIKNNDDRAFKIIKKYNIQKIIIYI